MVSCHAAKEEPFQYSTPRFICTFYLRGNSSTRQPESWRARKDDLSSTPAPEDTYPTLLACVARPGAPLPCAALNVLVDLAGARLILLRRSPEDMLYLQVDSPLLPVKRAVSKGGTQMPRLPHTPLRQCLEQVGQMGTDYAVSDEGLEWTAAGLLASLTQSHPERLALPMYMRLPATQQDGAICELTPRGGFILLYRIQHRTPH